MSLSFESTRDSVYCASSGAILFFGTDQDRQDRMVPCYIRRDVLAALAGVDDIDPAACLETFKAHRPRIEAIASLKHDACRLGREGRVTIEAADVDPNPGAIPAGAIPLTDAAE